jgi:hypothetical protein
MNYGVLVLHCVAIYRQHGEFDYHLFFLKMICSLSGGSMWQVHISLLRGSASVYVRLKFCYED